MALAPDLEDRPGHDSPSGWSLRDSIGGGATGLIVLALAVGLGAGLGALFFRYLIVGFTMRTDPSERRSADSRRKGGPLFQC
jgi:hypothetical protein